MAGRERLCARGQHGGQAVGQAGQPVAQADRHKGRGELVVIAVTAGHQEVVPDRSGEGVGVFGEEAHRAPQFVFPDPVQVDPVQRHLSRYGWQQAGQCHEQRRLA